MASRSYALLIHWSLAFCLLFTTISTLAQSHPTLSSIKRVYVEKMENNLDQYLTSEISHQFRGSLTVVLEKAKADAILRGVNIGAQQTTNSTVQLVDLGGNVILWSGSAGDRSNKFLGLTHGGQQKVAQRLVGQLRKAMQSK